MRAMVLDKPGRPLRRADVPEPTPGETQVLIRVSVCGLGRTDLHVVDGDLTEPKLPLIPGHQIVGGFAETCLADERFMFPIPSEYPDFQATPLLCAGLIGYRALCMAGDGKVLGFYGFGAAAHILIQVATYQGRQVYAFTRPGDEAAQEFARSLGALWADGSDVQPPEELDAAIIFAPVGELVPTALAAVRKGGAVVCAGIHVSDIPSFPYSILWGERVLRSVANLTRRDGQEFLALAPKIPVRTEVHPYPLEKANEALDDLRHGHFTGAAVIVVDSKAGTGTAD